MKSISKEIFIIALLLMIVVFMIGMVFYKFMPNNKTVPEPISYSTDSATLEVLQEISASNALENSNESDDEGDINEVEDIIKSYSIGEKELDSAATSQTYVSGKTDPFAEYTATNADSNTVDTNTTLDDTNTNTTNRNRAGSQPKTDTNSTGTFFEKKGSK